VVDEVLSGAGGGDQGCGADVVDGAGLAAGGLVDLGDGLVGEQFGGASCFSELGRTGQNCGILARHARLVAVCAAMSR
jgi:hypothetical protein